MNTSSASTRSKLLALAILDSRLNSLSALLAAKNARDLFPPTVPHTKKLHAFFEANEVPEDLMDPTWDGISERFGVEKCYLQHIWMKMRFKNGISGSVDHKSKMIARSPKKHPLDARIVSLRKEKFSWLEIGMFLNLHPFLVFTRYVFLTSKMSQKRWTSDEQERLLSAIKTCFGRWNEVSTIVQTKSPKQCMHRAFRVRNRKRWTEEEDEKLRVLVSQNGRKWSLISELMEMRTPAQVRERYVNKLDQRVKSGEWTEEEIKRLEEAVERIGQGKWAKIGAAVGTRTDNQCMRQYKKMEKEWKK